MLFGKAGVEPGTFGTKLERYDHCTTRAGSTPAGSLEKNSSVLAWPSLAEHSWSEQGPVAVKILFSRNFCVKISALSGTISRSSCGSMPPKRVKTATLSFKLN